MNFAVPADNRIKMKESKKKDNYLDFAMELKKKKTMEHESNNYTYRYLRFWYSHRRIN